MRVILFILLSSDSYLISFLIHFYRCFVRSNDLLPSLKITLQHLNTKLKALELLLIDQEGFVARRMTFIVDNFEGMIDGRGRGLNFAFLSNNVSRLSSIRFIFDGMTHQTSTISNIQSKRSSTSWALSIGDLKRRYVLFVGLRMNAISHLFNGLSARS